MKKLKSVLLTLVMVSITLLSLSCSSLVYGSERLTDQTDTQLITQLDSNLEILRETDKLLRQDLQQVNKQLTESLTDLETVNKQFIELRIVNSQQKISLENANRSLESLNDELKVEKRRNNQLKFWLVISGLIILHNK